MKYHCYRNSVRGLWLNKVSFLLLCIYTQLGSLFSGVGTYAVGLAFILVMFSGLTYKIDKSTSAYLGLFVFWSIMGLVVFSLGSDGDLPTRLLHLYPLVSLVLLVNAWVVIRAEKSLVFIQRAISVMLLFEFCIVFLQFLYISYGFGLAPKSTGSLITGFITGSHGNPNNVAVVLALGLMFLLITEYVSLRKVSGWVFLLVIFLAVFLTLSRTAFVALSFFIGLSIFSQSYGISSQEKRSVFKAMPLLMGSVVLLVGANFLLGQWNGLGDQTVIARSLLRLESIGNLEMDDSVGFRLVSTVRLFENLTSLGLGSLSDLNYGRFYNKSDGWLASVNPHSFIVEMSFLYGYVGLVWSGMFFFLSIKRIVRRYSAKKTLSIVFILSVLLFQMVPSSIMNMPIYFAIVVLAGTSVSYHKAAPSKKLPSASG